MAVLMASLHRHLFLPRTLFATRPLPVTQLPTPPMIRAWPAAHCGLYTGRCPFLGLLQQLLVFSFLCNLPPCIEFVHLFSISSSRNTWKAGTHLFIRQSCVEKGRTGTRKAGRKKEGGQERGRERHREREERKEAGKEGGREPKWSKTSEITTPQNP